MYIDVQGGSLAEVVVSSIQAGFEPATALPIARKTIRWGSDAKASIGTQPNRIASRSGPTDSAECQPSYRSAGIDEAVR